MSAAPLRRTTERAAPVRQLHMGLGSFFRAHQAWYAQNASDGDQWSIAAFSGRSTELAEALTEQGGRYTLVQRSGDRDRVETIDNLVLARPGADHGTWLRLAADPRVSLLTTTITEAGYLRDPLGALDLQREGVAADVRALVLDERAPVATAPGRILTALLARRAADAGPMTVIACDNVPDNAGALARVVGDMAEIVDPSMRGWMAENLRWIPSMVDRITPKPTPGDIAFTESITGLHDAAPVITEEFSDWVLGGDPGAHAPDLRSAGVVITDDVERYEARKLWLLNGAHTLLAHAGQLLGHVTVAEAIADPRSREWVARWWRDAGAHLPFESDEIEDYTARLLARFGNRSIRHELAQIARDGREKVPARILPVLRAERAAGGMPRGALIAIAAWAAQAEDRRAPEPLIAALAELAPDLADDAELARALGEAQTEVLGAA